MKGQFKQNLGTASALVLAALLLQLTWGLLDAADARKAMAEQIRRRPPNILLILADDLGYGDLGCYGQTRIQTPNLDRLASEGMRFTQFYAGSTVCAPSRAVLMTGKHTGHARIRDNQQKPLLAEDPTIAKLLDKAGYQTAAFGKWGLGLAGSTGVPNLQGFQEWRGYLDQTQAHDYYPSNLFRNLDPWPLYPNQNNRKGLYVQDLMIQMTTNYLRTAKYRPFFLYLPYTLPHANNELGRANGNGMEIPSDAPYGQQPWPQPEKNKAAMITRLDRDVGLILETLKLYHMESNTVVWFTSDNGPHSEGGVKAEFHRSSGPLRGIKRDLYEGGIRVPFIARWPGHIPAGRVNDEPCAFWDLLPTVTDLARVEKPPETDGLSFARTMIGLAPTNRHDYFYWEFHEGGSKQAVRSDQWKGVRTEPGKPLELYDLKADPSGTRNLASSHPEIIEKLEGFLKAARTDEETWPLKPKSKDADGVSGDAPANPKPASP